MKFSITDIFGKCEQIRTVVALKQSLNGSQKMISLPLKTLCRSSHPEMFLVKGVLKIRSKFTGEHPCQSVISVKLLCNFIEITLRHGCSPVNLLHISRTSISKNISGWLFLSVIDNAMSNYGLHQVVQELPSKCIKNSS